MNAVVLGGTHDHIKLIQILKEKGYRVVLIDYFENPAAAKYADEHIRESTIDKEIVLSISKEKQARLVISTCIDSSLATVAYVSEELSLPCHLSYKTALELTNKTLMKDIFKEVGIPTSKYLKLNEEESITQNSLMFPLVVKPADANGSKGVAKVNTTEALNRAVLEAYQFSNAKQVVVEEYIEGQELSVDVSLVNGVPTIIMITENIKSTENKNNFTIVKSQYPVELNDSVLSQIIEVSSKIGAAYNICNGPLLIQLIRNENEISVIEFSSRIGGGSKHHFIKRMTGFDMLEWFVDVILFKVNDVKVLKEYQYGSINYLYGLNGVIDEYVGFDELVKMNIIDDFYFYKTRGMEITNHIASSDRLAGYLITDNEYNSFIDKQSLASNTLKVRESNGVDMVIREYLI